MQGGEADAIRVRTLRGGWRWALAGAAALTIFLCVNQQFVLRFFVGFTPLNTEYYYALVLVMLPFVFVLFPGSKRAPVDRVPCGDVALFFVTLLTSLVLLLNIRKAAELGWEFAGAPAHIVWAGYLIWALLMEGLRRTGGWSLMLSVLPFTLYPLFAPAAPAEVLVERLLDDAGKALLAAAGGQLEEFRPLIVADLDPWFASNTG